MMVDVFMRDGRTTFRCSARGDVVALLKRKPADLDTFRSLGCLARWHPEAEFVPTRLQYLSASSVAFVAEVPKAKPN